MGNTVRKPRGFCYDRDKYSSMQLIEFINGRRRSLRKTNADLGKALGITGQTFGYYLNPERGNGKFDHIQLIKLFAELNATDEEILRYMKQN